MVRQGRSECISALPIPCATVKWGNNMSIMSKIGKVLTKVEGFFNVLAGIAICGMMLTITVNTILRYIFRKPITGVEELVSCYLSIILVYLSISYCYRRGGHVRVVVLEQRMPEAVQRVIKGLFTLIACGFFCLIAFTNITSMQRAYANHSVPGGNVDVPIWPGYLILVIGAFLMAFRLLLASILFFAGKRVKDVTPDGE